MNRFARGEGANQRFVCDILPQTEPAEHLLVVEVVTPSGHSSSYPPHKHDTDNFPVESSLEETYYHRLDPAQGFAFQRVYTDDRAIDESLAVENHDVVTAEKASLQKEMNYGVGKNYCVFLMSLRENAPYADALDPVTGMLTYEGHDEPQRAGGPNSKEADQPLATPKGSWT